MVLVISEKHHHAPVFTNLLNLLKNTYEKQLVATSVEHGAKQQNEF